MYRMKLRILDQDAIVSRPFSTFNLIGVPAEAAPDGAEALFPPGSREAREIAFNDVRSRRSSPQASRLTASECSRTVTVVPSRPRCGRDLYSAWRWLPGACSACVQRAKQPRSLSANMRGSGCTSRRTVCCTLPTFASRVTCSSQPMGSEGQCGSARPRPAFRPPSSSAPPPGRPSRRHRPLPTPIAGTGKPNLDHWLAVGLEDSDKHWLVRDGIHMPTAEVPAQARFIACEIICRHVAEGRALRAINHLAGLLAQYARTEPPIFWQLHLFCGVVCEIAGIVQQFSADQEIALELVRQARLPRMGDRQGFFRQ